MRTARTTSSDTAGDGDKGGTPRRQASASAGNAKSHRVRQCARGPRRSSADERAAQNFAAYLSRFAAALDGERLDADRCCVTCGWSRHEIVADPAGHRDEHEVRCG